MPSFPAGVPLLATLLLLSSAALNAQEVPLRQTIDRAVADAWKREKITPAARCDDATFMRRVYLDLLGVIPTRDEAKRFLDDPAPDKRAKLIESLLADPRCARQQADVWDLVLFGRKPGNPDATRKRDGFKDWLAKQFASGVPMDRLCREVLRAEQEGAELFYVQFRNQPEDATEAVTRIFLGMQLQCARCHDHPFESWTQRDFYGMAGFFVRLQVVDAGGGKKFRIGEKNTGEVLFTGSVKEQRPGQKGEPVRPKFLGGNELDEPALPKDFKEPDPKKATGKPLFSRKEKIADWMTDASNPYFARALANRLWAQFMGRGLVHPIDDLGGKNLPSHPELLDALTKYLHDTKFDSRSVLRELVSSETYQLADRGAVREALPAWFERARVRPLSAEELMASFRVATRFPADGFKGSGEPTPYMLMYFGEPTDGQGHFQGSLSEHLFLNNASYVRVMAQARKGTLAEELLTGKASWEEKVDNLYLSVLSRPPRADERARFVQHLQGGDAKTAPALVEEAIWVLMCCSEFRFNH